MQGKDRFELAICNFFAPGPIEISFNTLEDEMLLVLHFYIIHRGALIYLHPGDSIHYFPHTFSNSGTGIKPGAFRQPLAYACINTFMRMAGVMTSLFTCRINNGMNVWFYPLLVLIRGYSIRC